MKILGPPTASVDTIIRNIKQYNPHPRFINEMVPALCAVADEYGIDRVVMVAQSGLETGWGKFGDVLDASFHNTCGLKSRTGGSDRDPDAHDRSSTWYEGAEKHAQHLYAYMQRDIPSGKSLIDPRYFVVRGNPRYPAISDVRGLDAWASKPDNGKRILAIAEKLNAGGIRTQTLKKIIRIRSAAL